MKDSTDPAETFSLSLEAAELYESAFVPAFFAQWAPHICAAAGVTPGQRVLDVACGTGIVARTAAGLVGPTGSVVGVDVNEAMLAVAGRVSPAVEFRQGDAGALPFPEDSFDTVLCQFALMFFPDAGTAVGEMARVVRPGGSVAIMVPGALDSQPAFAPFVAMAARHAGPQALSLLSAYFVFGDLHRLAQLVESSGLRVTATETCTGTYRAASVDAFVTTEVEGTPLLERITDAVYRRIRADAHDVLAPFTTADQGVEAPFRCNLVVARRP